MMKQGKAGYPIREVILHCAGINTGQFDGMSSLQVFTVINRWHVERGFKSFGYHGLFMPDGTFLTGRPFHEIGAHCKERNRGTLGFLLIESRKVDKIGAFHDYYTTAQAVALRSRIGEFEGIHTVSGHNRYAAKLCPGFVVRSSDWLVHPTKLPRLGKDPGFPRSGDNFVTLD